VDYGGIGALYAHCDMHVLERECTVKFLLYGYAEMVY